tara:strand:- start:21147 stop:22565 length:1419 start_codon:yes stop_codon:yes gene_type:complete
MVGRANEIKTLDKILKKNSSSFLAITGRRRIGKTYLIDHYFKKHLCFRITGIQNVSIPEQLNNFAIKLAEFEKRPATNTLKNWQDAFLQLKYYLQSLDKRSKKVIFIDELPWMATSKSNFLQLLAHLWNDYLSKEKHFVLVVCGSASSWLTKNIINDTGGLHNRLTDLINLNPFTLSESKEFLKSLSIQLGNQEIVKLFMTFGGVPYYLEQIRKGESASVAIERICFSNEGVLKNEYENLYKALFKNAHNHEAIVKVLAKKLIGLTRKEIIDQSKISAGGLYNRTMEDLITSGFVTEYVPFGRKKRGVMYRLNDEYSIFYHRFMESNKKYKKGMWGQLSMSQSYKIWTGFAFENVCLKHITQLKSALGIAAIYTEESSYRIKGTDNQKGFQIDLIIDRKDAGINLCEMKFYESSFKIDKKYALELQNRRQRFVESTGTKKQVFNTMITNYEMVDNEYKNEAVDVSLTLDELF